MHLTKRRIAAFVVAVAVAAAAGLGVAALTNAGSTAPGEQTSLPGLTADRVTQLRSDVHSWAADEGEPNPTNGTIIYTTHHTFEEAIGDGVDAQADFPVYVVTFHGNFTAYGASRPSNDVPPPSGSFSWAVMDADTLATTDSGISAKSLFDPTQLGFPWMSLNLES